MRIEEIEAALNQLERKQETLTAELAAEQKRLAARSSTRLAAPIDGNLWTVQAASGEYVRKGQELFTVLDCSTVVVTASVSERDYNELRLGDPVRFRVSGSNREYSGTISKLGLTSTGRSFAIAPEERRQDLMAAQPVYCGNCGAPNLAGVAFCGRCGHPIVAPAPAYAGSPGRLTFVPVISRPPCAAAAPGRPWCRSPGPPERAHPSRPPPTRRRLAAW